MKLTLNIPESLEEITLGQYQEWLKVAESKEDESFLQQKMIEIFCNITLKQVLMIKLSDINEITSGLNKMFEAKNKLITTFKLNEYEFGFIPKLDEMSFGEYIDLDTYLGDWANIHKAMNVLFRPITFKKKNQYLIEEYKGSGKYDLKQMPLDVALGALVFFWNLKSELQQHILNYLENQSEIPISQEVLDSLKNGAGINPFTDLQTVTS